MNLDQDIRTMLRTRAEGVGAAPVIPHGTLRRARVRKTLMTGAMAGVVAALVFGGFAASRSLSNDVVPIPPAGETEDKSPLAVTYSFFDGEVSLHAAEPWAEHFALDPALVLDDNFEERLELDDDPRAVGTACRPGAAPTDAEELARTIRSDPDLAATAPVTVSVGGIDALRMDVTAVSGASVCSKWAAYPPTSMVLRQDDHPYRGAALEEGSRMRLYLLDAPEGSSSQILALWIVAPESRFEHVAEAAQPIVDSIEFHAP